jgi:hypothetical protein
MHALTKKLKGTHAHTHKFTYFHTHAGVHAYANKIYTHTRYTHIVPCGSGCHSSYGRMCMYVCMYVCACTHTHTHIHIYIHTYIYIYIYIHTHCSTGPPGDDFWYGCQLPDGRVCMGGGRTKLHGGYEWGEEDDTSVDERVRARILCVCMCM